MDILSWAFMALVAFQAVSLVPLVRRMRQPDLAVRSKARFDLLEAMAVILLLGSMGLSLTWSDWFWLTLIAWVLLAVLYAGKGVRWLRARRRSQAA
ncbi:hypothetical protein ACIRTB_12075 [Streptomyces sp. NPDC101158]|uniref:hypothetical protein n=1 Tax=Streptomyces sp. NPDC101158 TaxID=3366117 RepID=UPI0037F94D86